MESRIPKLVPSQAGARVVAPPAPAPPLAEHNRGALKRLSLPLQLQQPRERDAAQKRLSYSPGRASASSFPSYASARATAGASTSIAAPRLRGPLLGQPVENQLRELRARNTKLESSTATAGSSNTAELSRAAQRIANLERQVSDRGGLQARLDGTTAEFEALKSKYAEVEQDKEGWEAEAQRLQALIEAQPKDGMLSTEESERIRADLEALQEAVEEQKDRCWRAKTMASKFKCELNNRRAAENWEHNMLDMAMRQQDIEKVKLEYKVACLTHDSAIKQADEELRDEQMGDVDALTESRALLLESFEIAKSDRQSLKVEASGLKKDLAYERSVVANLRKQLDKTQATLASQAEELAAKEEETTELRDELVAAREGEVVDETQEAALRDAQKARAAAEKAADKERTKQAKLDAELKEMKAAYKALQAEVKASKTVSAPVSRKRKSVTPVVSDAASEVDEPEEEAEPVPAKKGRFEVTGPRAAKNKAATTLKNTLPSPEKSVSSPAPVEDESVEVADEEMSESYRPPAKKAAARARRSSSAAPAAKKRAGAVLGEKTGNAAKKAPAEKEKKGGKKGKEVVAEPEEGNEAAKKKKKKLWGGMQKTFEWESTDVNALGLPSILSPVKFGAAKASTGKASGMFSSFSKAPGSSIFAQ